MSGSHLRGSGAARAVSGYRAARLVRLRFLSRAVPLSHAARPSCVGMWRVSGLGGGAARSRPPVLGAGLGFVGGAMSVCTQPRCGTHTPPWAGWWVLNHKIHASTRSSETCALGMRSAWSCRTKISVVAVCGRGTTAKSLFGLTSGRCFGGLPPARSRVRKRGCRRALSVPHRRRDPCPFAATAGGVGGALSPSSGPAWR